jgi:uncharacterized membrane protein
MHIVDALRIGNLLLASFAAGSFVMAALVLIPARRRLPADRALEFWQLTTAPIDKWFPHIVMGSALTALLSVVFDDLTSGQTRYMLAGLIGTVGVAVISGAFFESRANRAAADWSPTSPPTEHTALLGRWDTMNSVRTTLAVGALLAFASAALAG